MLRKFFIAIAFVAFLLSSACFRAKPSAQIARQMAGGSLLPAGGGNTSLSLTGSDGLTSSPVMNRDMLVWMNMSLAPRFYIAKHAERWEPMLQRWIPRAEVLQPSRFIVDTETQSIYWRKDDSRDFYGEIFTYTDSEISLRQETFPRFPGVDPVTVWDARPDKFRLFSREATAAGSRPYGRGRIIAPRIFSETWNHSGVFNTFRCEGWEMFQAGACPLYQSGFQDLSVSLSTRTNFSTVFDGEDLNWPADPVMKNLDRVVIIHQEMMGGSERFYFGMKDDVYYGLVRWDYANANGVITERSVGLRVAESPGFSWTGMRMRAFRDRFPRLAGLRILSSAGLRQECPTGMSATGAIDFPEHRSHLPNHIYDLNGHDTMSVATVGVCSVGGKIALTLPDGCPVARRRGTLFVKSARVLVDLDSARFTTVSEAWVSLCTKDESDAVALRISQASCDPGTAPSGSVYAYKDAYDGQGRRIVASHPWLKICAGTVSTN